MKQLIDNLAADLGITKKKAGEVIDGVVEYIVSNATNNEKFKISGLGTFKVKERAAKNGVNPATGAKIKIPAKKTLTFTPVKEIKESLNS